MEKSIQIQINAKYHTQGYLGHQTKHIWFVLHGYGQLAEFFIKKFDFLDKETNYVIAPQGLNKFYLKEFSGRVGANWMTKEDRINEIANYISYLDAVYEHELKEMQHQITNKEIQVNLFAFSQGCSTASRWLTYTKFQFGRMLLWAGEIPQDVIDNPIFKTTPLQLVYGNQDELIKTEFVTTFLARLKQHELSPEIINFDGKHEVDETLLKKIIC